MNDDPESPGMIGEPPSARYPAVPVDPAEHAQDFSYRYAEALERHVRRTMANLGIPPGRIGMPDAEHGIVDAAFHAQNKTGGGFAPDGRIIVDSGVMNPALMDHLGKTAGEGWRNSRLKPRIEAITAHEYEEHRGGTHEYAVEHAPETALPIGDHTRRLLEAIREGDRGIRSAGSTHHP